MICVLKKKKYNLLIFQNIAQMVKKQVILLTIPNEENHQAKSKEWWHYLVAKILSALLRRITSKSNSDFYCLIYIFMFFIYLICSESIVFCNGSDFDYHFIIKKVGRI